ncbi:MAG: hypothetical protein M1834_008116 [Cirrosporium novae-zelandiae]|nr:MAG: hypothetical protein M1834_008116 [Cirrosporium novae-zelandiae]
MAHIFSRTSNLFSCPSGGDWYACTPGGFVGCCASDPCTNDCPDGNLKPASFQASQYGKFSDQLCNLGSSWYTCAYTDPPFMGCCEVNPCANTTGCPTDALTPGFLKSAPDAIAPFVAVTATGSVSTSTSTPTSAAITTTSKSSQVSTGAVVGAIIGSIAGVAILLTLLWFWIRGRRRRRSNIANSSHNMAMANHSSQPQDPWQPQTTWVSAQERDKPQISPGFTNSTATTPTLPRYTPDNPSIARFSGQAPTFGRRSGMRDEEVLSELPGESARFELETPHTAQQELLGSSNHDYHSRG